MSNLPGTEYFGGVDRFKPVPADKLYDVITVGRLAPARRIDTLMGAIVRAKERMSDIKAGIVGSGPLRASLEKLTAELGISENVSFLGWRENTEFYYNSSRVFALTSYYEGLPRSVLEAMACGLPCVVSNVGDIISVATDSFNALVVNDPYDVDAFADAILRLLKDRELHTRLSENSQQISRQYSYQAAT